MVEAAVSRSDNILANPRLPQLQTMLNETEMAGLLDRHLHGNGMAPDWRVSGCHIERVYYRPGKRCGVLYRLVMENGQGEPSDEWLFARIASRGRGRALFEKASSDFKNAEPQQRCLRAVPSLSYFPDLDMVFWIFPQDPKIASLQEAITPEFVKQHLEDNLHVFQGNGHGANGWHCTDVQFKRVKYMPGKRCVIRCQARLENGAGDSQSLSFFSKTYNDAISRYNFDFLKSAREQLMQQHAAVNIPQLLLHIDSANTSWYEDWPSQALIDVYETYDSSVLFPRIASTIAELHRSTLQGLPAGPDPDDALQGVVEDGIQLGHVLPQFRPVVSKITEVLQATKETIARQTIPVAPIHGAFRLEQLVIRDLDLAIVDFDALALSDPLADVAEFIASLHFLEATQGKARSHLEAAGEQFYRSYCEQVPWECDRQRIAWYALAFFISKMFGALKQLEVGALQRLEAQVTGMTANWLETLK